MAFYLPDAEQPLDKDSASAAFSAILDGQCEADDIAQFLIAMADRGESAVEIAAAATAMRAHGAIGTCPQKRH